MTTPVYWTNTHLFEEKSRVVDILPNETNDPAVALIVVLESTIFYPQGGKQKTHFPFTLFLSPDDNFFFFSSFSFSLLKEDNHVTLGQSARTTACLW
jgi:hypothetical protein